MPLPLFARVLESYDSMGGGHLSLTPVVGDIFMDPYLKDRINLFYGFKARSISSLSVTTNAVLANKYSTPDLKYIVNAFDRLYISVYGRDANEYAAMTNRSSFDDMLSSVRKIISLIDDIRKIKIGFRLSGHYTHEELTAWVRHNFGTTLPFDSINTYANWGNIDTSCSSASTVNWLPKVDNSTQCFIPLLAMQVFSDGQLSFCPCADYDADAELSIGHVLDSDLLTIYNTDKVRQLWNFENNMPFFCRHCTFHRSVKQLGNFMWIFDRPLDFIGG